MFFKKKINLIHKINEQERTINNLNDLVEQKNMKINELEMRLKLLQDEKEVKKETKKRSTTKKSTSTTK
jgi:uncharacterized coiled-coil protein SlyX